MKIKKQTKKEKKMLLYMMLLLFAIVILVFTLYVIYLVNNFQYLYILESRQAKNFCKAKGYWGGFLFYNFYPSETAEVHCYGKTDWIYNMEEMWR